MNKIQFSAVEKEMINFDFNSLQTHIDQSKVNLVKAESVADVKSEICRVWSKIGKYVKLAENIPVVGKFVKILADLLDSLCEA